MFKSEKWTVLIAVVVYISVAVLAECDDDIVCMYYFFFQALPPFLEIVIVKFFDVLLILFLS